MNYFKKCSIESKQQTGCCNFIVKCETSLKQDKLEKLCYNSEKKTVGEQIKRHRGQI